MKALFILALLFASAVAVQKVYLCGVEIDVADSFPSQPSLLSNPPSAFNAISFGDFYAQSGDVEGAVAIRNNLNLPLGQYSFGYQLRTAGVTQLDNFMKYSLVVGHDAVYKSGAIYEDGTGTPYAGSKQIGYIGGSLNTDPNSGITVDANQGNLDSQFDAIQSYYTQLGQAFAALPTQITAAYQYSGLTVTCPDNSASRWVVSVNADDMKKATYWTKAGCNDAAQFVFNIVAGTADVEFHGDNFPHDQSLIIYNVVGAQTVTVRIAVPGTLLAPNSVYNQPGQGVWEGLVIAGTMQQVLQINRPTCPKPPSPPSTPSTCVSWETQCAGLDFNLGEADSFIQYNAISFGDYNAGTGDCEGRVAARGNVNLGAGYSIGATLKTVNDMPDVHQLFSLIVGGDLTWISGALFPNTLGGVIEGAYVVGDASNVESDIAARVTKGSDLTSVFDAAQGCYCGMSDTLAAQASNTESTSQYSGLFVHCDDSSVFDYVLNVDADVLSAATYYNLDNCNFQARWTINVVGTSNVVLTGGSFPAPAGGVVYNVVNSNGRTVTVHDTQVNGHLLACKSTLVQSTGVIVGKVVVGDVSSTLQINSMNSCPTAYSVSLSMVAAAPASKGSFTVTVLNVGNFHVGDMTNLGQITDITGNTVTLNAPLAQDIGSGQVVATVYVSSTAGRGKVAEKTNDMGSNSASSMGVAAIAVAAAALMA